MLDMLIDNWRQVALKAWSMRLAAAAALLSLAEVVVPNLAGFVTPGTFAAVSVLISIGASLSRLVAQPASLPHA